MTLFDPTTGRYVTVDLRPYGRAVSPMRAARPETVGAGADAEGAEVASEGDRGCGKGPSAALPPGSGARKARRG